MTRGDNIKTLRPNEGITIPVGTVHRVENKGEEPAEMVEIQMGDYLGEDDIVRLDDDFGRMKK